MLSAIMLSAALAAGGCGGADYDIAFTEDGVQSSIANFVKEGDGYVAELPILEGGTIAPGIIEQNTLKVCNQTDKIIRVKATQKSILKGGTDEFFKDLTVNGIPVRDMTSPLPLKGINGVELSGKSEATTDLDYSFDFEATSGNRINAGPQKAVVEVRVEAEDVTPPPPTTPLAVTGAGVLGAIAAAVAGIASGIGIRRRK